MVAVIGINLDVLRCRRGWGALDMSGQNTGNMLFTSAVLRHIPGSVNLGFNFDPTKVPPACTHIVIPAANWVNAKEDWGWLYERLKQTTQPITMLGLGAQEIQGRDTTIPQGTLDLLNLVAKRSPSIGVRGGFTADLLRSLGIDNTVVLGCPSLFLHGRPYGLRPLGRVKKDRVAVSGTRFGFTKDDLKPNPQRDLMKFGLAKGRSVYYQSERIEIGLLCHEKDPDESVQRDLADYYGFRTFEALRRALWDKGRFHSDLNQWLEDVRKEEVFVSSRVHGVIAALNQGVPALLLAHDNRTREMAEAMSLPCLPLEGFRTEALGSVGDFLAPPVLQAFEARNRDLWSSLESFYNAHKVPARLTRS